MADTAVSATDIINDYLTEFGLQSLAGWAFDQLKLDKNWSEIHLAMKDTPEYKARFPAMKELADLGRPINEGEYKAYELGVRALSQRYGIPYDMYSTPGAIAKMLINKVDPAEMNERFQRAAYGAMQAPEEVKRAYRDLYGLDQGALIATYLDADKALPILQNMAAASAVEGAAYKQGMAASLSEAERLASMGIDYGAALQGYGQAAGQAGLDTAAGLATTREDRVAAAFGDQAAQRRVQQAAAARQAQFQAGGGLVAGNEGVAGLGRGTA